MLENLTHSSLSEQLNTKFKIYHDSGEPVETELIEVCDPVETKRQVIFSILFSVPEGVRPAQGSYRMEHDKLGDFVLFLVPVVADEGTAYEAVFNRIKKKNP